MLLDAMLVGRQTAYTDTVCVHLFAIALFIVHLLLCLLTCVYYATFFQSGWSMNITKTHGIDYTSHKMFLAMMNNTLTCWYFQSPEIYVLDHNIFMDRCQTCTPYLIIP